MCKMTQACDFQRYLRIQVLLALWSLDLNQHFCLGEWERQTPLMQFSVNFARVTSMTGIRKDVKQQDPQASFLFLISCNLYLSHMNLYLLGNAVSLIITFIFLQRHKVLKNNPVPMYSTRFVVSSYLEANNNHVGLLIFSLPLNLPPSYSLYPPPFSQIRSGDCRIMISEIGCNLVSQHTPCRGTHTGGTHTHSCPRMTTKSCQLWRKVSKDP